MVIYPSTCVIGNFREESSCGQVVPSKLSKIVTILASDIETMFDKWQDFRKLWSVSF